MTIALWLLLGLLLGSGFIVFERLLVSKERRFMAVGIVVVALIYLGFAVIGGGGTTWVLVEMLGVVVYGAAAWLGMRYSPWWLLLGWAVHPVWDIGLHFIGDGAAFTPGAYAVSCISFDLLVAGYIARRLGTWQGAEH